MGQQGRKEFKDPRGLQEQQVLVAGQQGLQVLRVLTVLTVLPDHRDHKDLPVTMG